MFSHLFDSFRRGGVRRTTARSLRSLSSAQLADLGIPSDQIDDVVDDLVLRNEHRAERSTRPASPHLRAPVFTPRLGRA